MSVFRYRPIDTRFQLDACGKVSVGTTWAAWRSSFRMPRPNSFLCRPKQAASAGSISLSPGLFIQEAATQPTTGAQAQHRQTNEDGILEGDVM